MRKLTLLLPLLLLLGWQAAAQQAVTEPTVETFQLGNVNVKVPAPDGFIGIMSTLDKVVARLRATEAPGNDMLTSHIAKDLLPKYQTNQEQDLDVYTKISVIRSTRTVEITPTMFGEIRTGFENQIDAMLTPDSAVIKSVQGNTGKALSELWGKDTTVKVNEPRNLGFFERSSNTISAAVFLNFDINGRKFSTLATMSMVHVKKRVIAVFTYKMNPKAEDIDFLRSFAKAFNAKIVAANQGSK